MFNRKTTLKPTQDRGPLRILFVITSMPVGGAEMLLVNLIRRLDRGRFLPEVVCLKELGPLGEVLSQEIPVHHGLIRWKGDLRIFGRLTELIGARRFDAVITVGASDKMFWGRLAARWRQVPVIASALHSTGWPDGVGWLNRRLTGWTDALIGVAKAHGEHLIHGERFPADKVWIIPNGVDTATFQPSDEPKTLLRHRLGLPDDGRLVGIVAALRPEKNHRLFLQVASRAVAAQPEVRFLVIGDGPERVRLEKYAEELAIGERVHFLGNRSDIDQLLTALDLFVLTSDNEANPVSILEAMACGIPIVATRVGSVSEMVLHNESGLLADARDASELAAHVIRLLENEPLCREMGQVGRQQVLASASIDTMVHGYEHLVETIYNRKASPVAARQSTGPPNPPAAILDRGDEVMEKPTFMEKPT